MTSRIRTLNDLVSRGLYLRVWCLVCARSSKRMAPAPIAARFVRRGWSLDLIAARCRFRCKCGLGDHVLLVPASPPKPRVVAPPTEVPAPGPVRSSEYEMTQLVAAAFRQWRGEGKRARQRETQGGIAARLGNPPGQRADAVPPPLRGFAAALAWQRAQQRRAAFRLIERPPPPAARLTAALDALEVHPMCNRYQLRDSHAEIAQLALGLRPERLNYAGEVYPGYSGLVFAGEPLQARVMTWGFPLALTGKQGQKLKPRPINNAREDKLNSFMWRESFAKRRCLIPATAWAEAEGEKGKMTCTWHALPGDEPFMLGGIWRPTDEWGDAYSMVMVDGCPQMAEVHDRMPVILAPNEWQRWTDGTSAEAFALCRTWPHELTIERTDALWAAKS